VTSSGAKMPPLIAAIYRFTGALKLAVETPAHRPLAHPWGESAKRNKREVLVRFRTGTKLAIILTNET
jgi:hypothetical protein